MKKNVLAVVMSTAMAAALLAGCGGSASSSSASSSSAAGSETAAVSEAASAGSGSGSVYMLNFKPETDGQWQDLAAAYTKKTGVPVTVVTAASGTYDTTLTSEMSKSEAPTIFNIGNSAAAQTWDDYTMDLKDSALYKHLTDKSLVVDYNGKTAAVANCYECYGIIYNKTILQAYCDKYKDAVIKSPEDIKDLDTLEKVAADINSHVDAINKACGTELTEAFASAGLDDGSSWRFSGHLANLPLYYEFKDDGCDLLAGEATIKGKYLDNYKKVWDMYVKDSAADPGTLDSGSYNAESELGMGEAVFYQNGDWEFSGLTDSANGYTVKAADLDMMPIYFGVDDANEGLCIGTENYWAVNSKASKENIDASLAFLEWVITSDEGRDSITNKMGLSAPFDTFTDKYASANPFKQTAAKMMNEGKTSIAWSFNATPNVDDWRKGVVSALTDYTKGTGKWDAVKTAFVTGWSDQWKLAHEK